MDRVLAIGMINCDIAMFPIPESLDNIDLLRIQPPTYDVGGDATNVAMTLAKLGKSVSLVGRVGTDVNASLVLNTLKDAGIDIDGVISNPDDVTTTSYHLLQMNGKHKYVFYSTTMDSLCCEDVTDEQIRNANIVYFGSALTFPKMDFGGIENVFRRVHQNGKLTVMDASLANYDLSGAAAFSALRGALAETDIFFPSIEEVIYLTGEQDPHQAAEHFKETGIKLLGIKRGKSGSYVTDFKTEYYFSSFSFNAVDTVGAGDSFMGGLIASILDGGNIIQNINFASAVAGFNVEKIGASAGVPKHDVVETFVQQNALEVQINAFAKAE